MNLSDIAHFIRLARSRLESPEHYLQFQVFQGELTTRYLVDHDLNVDGNLLLDVACGWGGFSLTLRDHGGKVVSLDQYITPRITTGKFVTADALSMPFANNQFDIVLSPSLIEHVTNPGYLIQELDRVTRPGGVIYISFPPYYSPMGGHQFSPFHLLGEHLAVKVYQMIKPHEKYAWIENEYSTHPSNYADSHGSWGLYRRTIKEVKQLLSRTNLEIMDQSTRWMPINFSRIPVLGEFLTWHVQFLLRKPDVNRS